MPEGRLLSRIGTFGIGLLIKKASDYAFDYLLYPAALIFLGYVWGGLLMMGLSVVLNLLTIRAYDWSKRDWLMLETLKGLREAGPSSRAAKFLAVLLRKGDAVAFLALSWFEDPIVVTLYLRQGVAKFDGLSRRDWCIFWASTVVSNLLWTFSLASVIALVRNLGWSG